MEVEGLGPAVPYRTFLDEVRNAGYTGTELGPYGYLPTDAKLLSSELKERGLSLISAFVPLALKQKGMDMGPLRQVAQLLASMGASHVVLADQMWPERDRVSGRVDTAGVSLTRDDWQTVATNVREGMQAAEGFGLRPVFHHHAGTYIETPAEVAQLLDLTGIGLCLDTGHYAYGGGDPVEAVRRLGKGVEYLHFKDIDSTRLKDACRRELGFLDGVRAGVFTPLGSGSVSFPGMLAELKRIGYNGWVIVEQDVDTSNPAAPSPFESARTSREYLRGLGI